MHQALQCKDILHEIFNYLSGIPTQTGEPRIRYSPVASLLYAATTCSAFKEPALDKLWWQVEMKDLFSLIPAIERDGATVSWYLKRPLLESDWQIADTYAKRVRALYYDEDSDDAVSPSMLLEMVRMRPHVPLFPSLRELFVKCNGGWALPLLHTPTLKSVKLTIGINEPECQFYPSIWNFVDQLPERAPNLEWLSLGVVSPPRTHASIARLKNLRYLLVYLDNPDITKSIDISCFTSLASLERLETLRFKSYHIPTISPASRLPEVVFPSLTNLHISTTTMVLLSYFGVALYKQLESLSITLSTIQEQNEYNIIQFGGDLWTSLIHYLGKSKCFKVMKIDQEASFGNFFSPDELPGLRDLFCLCLTELDIKSPIFLSVSKEDISMLADIMPALQVLYLATQTSEIDFTVLIVIATKLPDLKKLGLSISVNTLPDTKDVPILCHGLRVVDLYITTGSLKDPFTFARLLDKIFPSIDITSIQGMTSSRLQVCKTLADLQEARRMLTQGEEGHRKGQV